MNQSVHSTTRPARPYTSGSCRFSHSALGSIHSGDSTPDTQRNVGIAGGADVGGLAVRALVHPEEGAAERRAVEGAGDHGAGGAVESDPGHVVGLAAARASASGTAVRAAAHH